MMEVADTLAGQQQYQRKFVSLIKKDVEQPSLPFWVVFCVVTALSCAIFMQNSKT